MQLDLIDFLQTKMREQKNARKKTQWKPKSAASNAARRCCLLATFKPSASARDPKNNPNAMKCNEKKRRKTNASKTRTNNKKTENKKREQTFCMSEWQKYNILCLLCGEIGLRTCSKTPCECRWATARRLWPRYILCTITVGWCVALQWRWWVR